MNKAISSEGIVGPKETIVLQERTCLRANKFCCVHPERALQQKGDLGRIRLKHTNPS